MRIQIIETVKKYPIPVLGGLAVAIFFISRGSSGNGQVSDSVQIASINAQKEIAVKQLETSAEKKAVQAELIATRITSGNDTRLGLAISRDNRVVDLSKVKGDVAINRLKDTLEYKFGIFDTKANANVQNNKIAAERQVALSAHDVARYGITSALEAQKADINGRVQTANIAAQIQRERNPWEAQIANARIEADKLQMQLQTMLGFDSNATNVTLAKKQLAAQQTQAITGLVSDFVVSGNQTASSVAGSFFGAVGDVFGGMGGGMLGGMMGG